MSQDIQAQAAQAVDTALETVPATQWPHRIDVSLHESVLVYFEQAVEEFGVVRVQTSRDGMQLWVGGECRWRSGTAR